MSEKILIIRRDNIGDLVCTTLAIRALREHFPASRIGILVNSYNAEVMLGSPDVDEIYVYQKAKHVPGRSRVSVWLDNFRVLVRIRKERFDVAIACGSYSPTLENYTRLTGARRNIGFGGKANAGRHYTDVVAEPQGRVHEVERTFHLMSPLGITGLPPAMRLVPDTERVERLRRFLSDAGCRHGAPLVAMHISSRRAENRWPLERFAELATCLDAAHPVNILLLWVPGTTHSPTYPGDDDKVHDILDATTVPLIAFPTTSLKDLVAALSVCSLVVCCDGGAMHLAAALGKPIVTVWGSTNQDRWAPWGTEHVILQEASGRAEDVPVAEVLKACSHFLGL